jgi:hypothetical protein
MPLDITLLVIQGTGPNLKQPHTHPRAYFCELDGLVSCLDEDVMAHFNCVLDVLEGDDAGAYFGIGFPWWEKVLEDLYGPLA